MIFTSSLTHNPVNALITKLAVLMLFTLDSVQVATDQVRMMLELTPCHNDNLIKAYTHLLTI